MNIRIQRCDARIETIVLTEPITIHRGTELDCLKTSTGMSHFFTKEGKYDGWEIAIDEVSGIGIPLEDAVPFALRIDAEREIEDQP